MKKILKRFNIVRVILEECKSLECALWRCPPFLFIILGVITILAILATGSFSSFFTSWLPSFSDQPEMLVIIIPSLIAILFLTVGNLIISGFRMIVEANYLQAKFISIVSHQLRGPLSMFRWTLEALDKEAIAAESPPAIVSHIKNLQDANERMIHFINTLLDVAHIESNSFVLKEEEFSLPEVLTKTAEKFERATRDVGIALRLDIDPRIPPLYADRQRIQEVIDNLLDNAIRYTVQPGSVEVSALYQNPSVRIAVADTGMGIPLHGQKFIFHKFFRAANSIEHQSTGTGIGLYFAKIVIERSGGTIGFTSQEGKGSTFWFTLPVKKEPVLKPVKK